MDEVGNRQLGTSDGLIKAAFTVKVSELTDTFVTALGIDNARAKTIVSLFLCDPAQTSRLFTKSLWATPLLPAPDDRCHIVLAPLLMATPRRRVEAWLERGGISDQGRVKGRGKLYESHVRDVIGKDLAKNPRIADYACLATALKRTDGGEEIDLLARIGNTVLVGDVKCLLAPAEPMERFNYLDALEDAAEQVWRKCDWIERNRSNVLTKLGIPDEARAAEIRLVPIVILNQGYGFGLDLNGVAFTDLHFLSLLLRSGTYAGDTRFERGSIINAPITLYSCQAELESQLHMLLTHPRPLRRYEGKISWQSEPFPNSTGRPFAVEFPRLTGTPFETPELAGAKARF
jgi:hypothetical protein